MKRPQNVQPRQKRALHNHTLQLLRLCLTRRVSSCACLVSLGCSEQSHEIPEQPLDILRCLRGCFNELASENPGLVYSLFLGHFSLVSSIALIPNQHEYWFVLLN